MEKLPYAVQAEINRLVKTGMSVAEATELAKYDYAVDHDEKTEYDLTPEQEKASKKARSTGTRKVTTYNFKKAERKPNDTKRWIMQDLKTLLDGLELNGKCQGVTLSNPERAIDFIADGKSYTLTLTEHRPKKE